MKQSSPYSGHCCCRPRRRRRQRQRSKLLHVFQMPVVLILVTWLAVATQPAVGLLLSPYLQIQQQQKQPWMNRRRQSALLFGGGGSSDTIPRVPIAPLGNEGFTSPTPTAELLEEPAQLLRRNPILLSGEDIQRQMEAELARLQIKDALSPKLAPEDLTIVFEDEHIVVVDKPSGVLSVAGTKSTQHSLAQTVFEYCAKTVKLEHANDMVVHRLGMDSSGVMVFAKTLNAVRGMNAAFRARSVDRIYTALVCGHVRKNRGFVPLPLMRDYEHVPYQRISTDEHQEALVHLDPLVVGKKLLEMPKQSLTKYEVLSREELNGAEVTRVQLTSISGRTHQLNCHMAAFGHAIVGDSMYGISGSAAPNGGLTDNELSYLAPNAARATDALQQAANAAVSSTACHASAIRFRHPVTKKKMVFTSEAPF